MEKRYITDKLNLGLRYLWIDKTRTIKKQKVTGNSYFREKFQAGF